MSSGKNAKNTIQLLLFLELLCVIGKQSNSSIRHLVSAWKLLIFIALLLTTLVGNNYVVRWNEEDYFSSSSSSSSIEDRNTEKITSKEFKIVKNNDSKDSTYEEGKMFEGKPFCSKYRIPTNDENTVDILLTELINHKKQGSREFTTASQHSHETNKNHHIEVPMGNSFLKTRGFLNVCATW